MPCGWHAVMTATGNQYSGAAEGGLLRVEGNEYNQSAESSSNLASSRLIALHAKRVRRSARVTTPILLASSSQAPSVASMPEGDETYVQESDEPSSSDAPPPNKKARTTAPRPRLRPTVTTTRTEAIHLMDISARMQQTRATLLLADVELARVGEKREMYQGWYKGTMKEITLAQAKLEEDARALDDIRSAQ